MTRKEAQVAFPQTIGYIQGVDQVNTEAHKFGDRDDGAEQTLSLYVHIPFCRRKCIYCDFNSYGGLESVAGPYVEALTAEIKRSGKSQSGDLPGPELPPASTIYFGGGTPTLLQSDQLKRVLAACREVFDVAADAEITVEANPGTVDARYLRQLRAAGVNRLSLGVQSFDDEMLRVLGRLHSSQEAKDAYGMARRAGFENVSLDLIYALPSQGLAHWRSMLCQLLDLSPAHASLYALTVEEKTALHKLVQAGRVALPDEDLAAEMYLMAQDQLASAGYSQYEISNWALCRPENEPAGPGTLSLACQHNLTYWQYRPYLGFGAGAHSFANGRRWSNVRRPQDYVNAISTGNDAVAEVEELDGATRLAEAVMLGLRLSAGIDYAAFRDRFGIDLTVAFGPVIEDLLRLGLVESDERLRLTSRGLLLGNEVFARFLP